MTELAAVARPPYPPWAREPAAWWRLSEPSNVVTNLALAAVAALLALRLAAAGAGAAALLLTFTLALVAAAAITGAAVHGLTRQLGERRWRGLWRLTLLLAALVSCALLAGVAVAELRGDGRAALVALAVTKLLLAARLAWRDAEFRWVVLDSGVSLAVVAIVEATAWATRGAGAPAAPWLLGSVAVSVLAGLAQRRGLRLHEHLNHNDLYHLGQMVAVYLLYRGARLLVGA